MSTVHNKGFDPSVIADYRQKMEATGTPFLWVDEQENTDEHVHFYFIGKHEGKEVIYDTVLYTLRLQHESELFEIAEHKAAQHFPDYKKITYQEDENGNLQTLDDLEEEIGLFMAEVMMEMEEEGEVKVQEHVDIDTHLDFGIGLDVGLHVDVVDERVISKFIQEFNSDTLKLDPQSYSFQTQSQEAR
ncbi:MAG: hypothetical protein ACOYXA_15745 [Bacteroidota bacterium]